MCFNDSESCLSVKSIQCSIVSTVQKHSRTKNTHTHTFPYRWWRSLNCPSHSSPCILTVCLFSQADIIVKLFLKQDTIEKADSCSMARVLPLIPNRAVYSSVDRRSGEKLCSALVPWPFFKKKKNLHRYTYIHTHKHKWMLTSIHVHTHTHFHLNIAPVPMHSVTWYSAIPTDQWKPRRHHTHLCNHTHTRLCVARRQMVSAVDACYSQQLWYGHH